MPRLFFIIRGCISWLTFTFSSAKAVLNVVTSVPPFSTYWFSFSSSSSGAEWLLEKILLKALDDAGIDNAERVYFPLIVRKGTNDFGRLSSFSAKIRLPLQPYLYSSRNMGILIKSIIL